MRSIESEVGGGSVGYENGFGWEQSGYVRERLEDGELREGEAFADDVVRDDELVNGGRSGGGGDGGSWKREGEYEERIIGLGLR
ncbi:hypothetical protein V6N12_003243 [Hibiscus sabdariffa]|uniref:Uncharacterized protein n=1 Tax=Hibiscus sabdariffa TaxID=183260 RepID=A0ABR2EBB5_9ROSI